MNYPNKYLTNWYAKRRVESVRALYTTLLEIITATALITAVLQGNKLIASL